MRASRKDREAALGSLPLERLRSPDVSPSFVAGGAQTQRGALPIETPRWDGAIYSTRGRGYASYNEDAAALFFDERGRVYAGVFDQAGGLGGRTRGDASRLAATTTFEAFRRLVEVDEPNEVATALMRAIVDAHELLVSRRQGEVTTAIVVVARDDCVIVANSGDSGAMHFSAGGTLAHETEAHEAQLPIHIGCLVHAIGLTPSGPAPDTNVWPVAAGDWVLLASDGFLDANFTRDEIAKCLNGARNAEAAVDALCTRTLRSMARLRAKPDNLSLVALFAK